MHGAPALHWPGVGGGRDSLLAAFAANSARYHATYGTLPGGASASEGELRWFRSDIPEPWFNGILAGEVAAPPVPAAVERWVADLASRGLPFLWHCPPDASDEYQAALLACGLRSFADEPVMAVDLAKLSDAESLPLGLTVEHVADAAGLSDWTAVWMDGVPKPTRGRCRAAYHTLGPRFGDPYLGRLAGEPVVAMKLFRADGLVSVQHVKTLAAARRCGFGRALVAHALRQARDRGETTAVLTSTPVGVPLYTSLGFRTVCRCTSLIWTPAEVQARIAREHGDQTMTSGGLSAARLARVHDLLRGHIVRGAVPGLVALIARDDTVWTAALGARAIEGASVGRDTIFRISSMTKPIIAVAALILIEECRLRLDDPVDEFLPELADRRVLRRLDGPLDETEPAARAITVRDLLTFRLGLGQQFADPDEYPILRAADELAIGMGPPSPATTPAPDEWLRRLGTLPLMVQPGTQWMYNIASDVLGILIARVAEQPLEAFLRERIFAPLGMRDTAFSVPPEKIDRLATAYAPDPATGALTEFDPAVGGGWSSPPAFQSGAGGLVSSIDDYHTFARMLLNGGRYGGVRIISRPAVELLTTDHLLPGQRDFASPFLSDDIGWGFGVGVTIRRNNLAETVGTYSWAGGLGSLWANDPRERMTTILLTQVALGSPTAFDLFNDFMTAAYAAIDD